MRKKMVGCLIVTTLLLSGCWDQRELSTITVVVGMAIDVGKKAPYKLTIEGINAAELNEQTAAGNSPTVLFSLEGNTIAELAQKMNIGVSRNVVYSHMKTLVISKEIAEKGMLDFIDFLERNREIRDDFNFLVAKEGKAADILKVLYTIQKSSSLKLRTQLETAVELWGSDPDIRLTDFLNALLLQGRQPVLAVVRVKGDPEKGKSVDNMTKSEPEAMVVIDSMAVFRGEKLAGFLSVEETRNYMFTQNKLKKTIMSIPCDEDRFFAIGLKASETKVKGVIKNGRPHIQLNIMAESYISANQCSSSLDSPDTYAEYEKLAREYIQKNISDTIQKVQQDYGLDIFGFGEYVARQDYKQYKKLEDHWDEAFQDAEIDVNVVVNISRSGLNSRGVLNNLK